jgi:DNA repair exonuclease SbcCD ATPase subunit
LTNADVERGLKHGYESSLTRKATEGRAKKPINSVKQSTSKTSWIASTSRWLRRRIRWIGVGAVVVLAVFWALPTFAGSAPGQFGYSIKRAEESLAANLAPFSSWRSSLQLNFADNRLTEAEYVANQANQNGDKNPAETAATINGLLDSYQNTYEAQTVSRNQDLDNGVKGSLTDPSEALRDAANSYATLESLLLQAPAGSQLAVLTAIDSTQRNIATLNDALGSVPLSASDFSQLAKLVSAGVVSQSDVSQLSGAKSSRQLHTLVQKLIESGELPSDLSYIFDLDIIKHITPDKAQVFETVAQVEQMKRISAVITASRPTAEQQKAIQKFFANYTAGQAVPDSDIHQYVTPVVDGMLLSGQLQANLPSLNALRMRTDDQALFDSWKGVLDPPNLVDTYQKLMTDALGQPMLHLRILTTTQQELIDAQKSQVAYLVMPPGWDTNQFSLLNNQMGTSIAEANYVQSNPSTAQELARLSAEQQQLQAELSSLSATYNDNSIKLQTQINNFNGTPDQLAGLKDNLANLTQSQTTTTNDLQTQLTAITDAHSQLGGSIEKLRQQQATNLTELELRAATNAQQLTDNAKAQLTSSLNQIDAHSHTLITNLRTKVDSLESTNNQLRGQLTTEIHTITDNYQQLATNVQSQLDAGVSTTSQLQSSLSHVQSDLAGQQTKLSGLTSSTTALTQLIGQVKTDSSSQVQGLQSQINVVKLDQQTTQAAVGDLQNVTQTSQSLITNLQSRVDGLGTGQTNLREELTATLQTVQDNYAQLSAYTQAQLDTGLATSTRLQTTLQNVQANVDQHTAQLASLGSSNAALNQLVDQIKTDSATQVSTFQSQINGLSIGQQTIRTSINDVKTQQAADIAQLSSHLAGLSVLQTEAQVTISNLTQAQAQGQTQIDHLTTNVGLLQTAFNSAQQAQTIVQADIINQQSEINSLQTQTQTALDALSQQQSQFATQLSGLATTTTSLSQAVSTVQTAGTATQTQINTLLSNPPWALASAAYVTQDQLNNLSSQLTSQFAQKSAQLDQQFQAYQSQLNTTVSQLNNQVQSLSNTTSNNAATQSQQQAQINTLNTQVQTLQTQLQQLINSTTPHTTVP